MRDGAGGVIVVRPATPAHIPAVAALMQRAIGELQKPFLTPEQIAASAAQMGLDRTLIEDGTYFCALAGGELVGCGGWSRRATLYGGDHSAGRDSRLLDPSAEPARIRAMYTHPRHVRRGIGRMILAASEAAARAAGFTRAELVATMAGVPLYLACGYAIVREWEDCSAAVPVPLATMAKDLA